MQIHWISVGIAVLFMAILAVAVLAPKGFVPEKPSRSEKAWRAIGFTGMGALLGVALIVFMKALELAA